MNSLENPYFAIILTYVIIISLCIGSFLNVVILRGLSGEDIVLLPSKCPSCNNKLTWYMNIPLISYLFLKGKCAYCKKHISIQYPLVEAITAFLFTCAYLKFGLSFNFGFSCLALALFIVMCATDIKKTVIINIHAYILAFVGLIYSCFPFSSITIAQSILGGIFGFFFFEGLCLVSKKIIGYRMFGEGDSLISIGLGTFFGIKTMLVIIPLSFLIQFIFAAPLLIKNCFKKNNKKLAYSYIIMIIGVFLLMFLNLSDYINTTSNLYLFLAVLISLLLVYALSNLLIDIKNKAKENKQDLITDELDSSFSALPFGPALLIAGVLCLFYLDNFKNIIKTILLGYV